MNGVLLSLSNRGPFYLREEEVPPRSSVISDVCLGIMHLFRDWHPSPCIHGREYVVFPPVGVGNLTYFWGSPPLPRYAGHALVEAAPRRVPIRPPDLNQAPQQERPLSRTAGARNFFDRAILRYVESLQKPLQDADREITELTRTNSPELPEARRQREVEAAHLQERLENVESLEAESMIALFEQMVAQAVLSNKPLQQNGVPTDELPPSLHGIIPALEEIRASIRATASRLHQGNPHCLQALQPALSAYLASPVFQALKSQVTRPLPDAS